MYYAYYERGKVSISPATNPLNYNDDLPARCVSAVVAQML